MKFWAKGDGKPVKIKVCSTSVGDYDYHGTSVTPSADWAEYSVDLSSLKQEGWGRKTAIDLRQINKIQFESGSKAAGEKGFVAIDGLRFE
jgi:hypothetical protein